MKHAIILSAITVFSFASLFAQHEHHAMEKKDTSRPAKVTRPDHHDQHKMTHAYSVNLPMNRNSSGTAWLPDQTPMYMYMTGRKAMWMFHGNIFLRYTNTDIFNAGQRGNNKVDAPNWLMAMVNKQVGKKGLFSAKAMISLDPLTEGGNGYPLLFQSGETYRDKKLVDRQHPHDLFSELSIGYSYALNKDIDIFGYIGYPGEPALSAPAFMHRISSMNNPDAPLGHHWQDATHITFGVTTLGFRYKQFKLEGSAFTGREPNEERYGFDKARFDSYSYRLSYNPSPNWALQFSQGFINEPEILEPGVDVTRTTASVLYSKKAGKNAQHDAALIWGLNQKGDGHDEHSLLWENNYRIGKNAIFSRYEFIQKSTEELDMEDELGDLAFNVHAFSIGYNRSLWQKDWIELAAGAKATISLTPTELKSIYGNVPVGFQFYFQLRPILYKQ